MKKLSKNGMLTLESLPATSKQISESLGLTRPCVNSYLKILVTKGLAARSETILVPHGHAHVYSKTSLGESYTEEDYVEEYVPISRVLPNLPMLTQWRTALPWEVRV